MELSAIVFDCDGVILESAGLKSEAFFKLGAPYGPEAQKRLFDYHNRHTGVSRYTKFAWFYHTVLGREITSEESERLGRLFAGYCLEAVRKAPLVPGFQEMLDEYSGRLPLFVASGTPYQELAETLRCRGLADKFAGIYGSPPAKADLLRNIIVKNGFAPEKVLMVGDGETDYEAAQINGARFYGRGRLFAGRGCPWSEDLTGAVEALAR